MTAPLPVRKLTHVVVHAVPSGTSAAGAAHLGLDFLQTGERAKLTLDVLGVSGALLLPLFVGLAVLIFTVKLAAERFDRRERQRKAQP